ncbi:hypothetical protein GCM10007877_00130 [Marinibactrum halimedae]|uniref:Leucine-rich repeat domain-containing protein n=2 Tax=Marinibactrum halimedae TaxID=1444977 RepID=A0AA37T357_9GAMM|nr:hypothetical protein GCM10007877_00130 [Marinibactrum halimedae]
MIKKNTVRFCKCYFITLLLFAFMPSSLAESFVEDENLAACLAKMAAKHGWQSPEAFTEVVCHNKGITNMAGLEHYIHIEKLSLHKNKITDFDATPFKALKILNLARNRITSLTVESLPELRELYIFDNKITALSLNQLPKLEKFKASSNKIEVFDYNSLPKLTKVYMFDNNMEHIDIYSLPSMKYMDVRQNPMPDALYEEMDKVKEATILHDGNADDWD